MTSDSAYSNSQCCLPNTKLFVVFFFCSFGLLNHDLQQTNVFFVFLLNNIFIDQETVSYPLTEVYIFFSVRSYKDFAKSVSCFKKLSPIDRKSVV